MKNRQGITIAALIIAIVGLSIGFAAFSNTLTISSTASVNPDASNLKVVFANNTDVNNLNTNPVQVFSASTGASGTPGTINNEALNGPTLTGLKASFTAPNQSVVYKLNVVNAGKLKAYLTDIVFGTTGNPAKTVSCTVATKDSNNQDIPAAQQATDSLVQSACNGISISVKIGELDAKTASGSLNNLELNVAGYKEVIITISYASGSAYVDGPMNVAFGDIEINAASSNAGSNQGGNEQGGGQEQALTTSDYIVSQDEDNEGEYAILKYTGTETSITIPSQLPLTTFTLDNFDMSACIENYDGETDEEKQEGCLNRRNYIMNGASNSELCEVYSDPDFMPYVTLSVVQSSTLVTPTVIGYGAFERKGLTSVTIPDTITKIGRESFYRNNLTTVVLGSGVTELGTDVFANNSITSVTIPASLRSTLESKIDSTTFGYNPNANCENTINGDYSSNSCITWVNG